jgi:hypothetical protein
MSALLALSSRLRTWLEHPRAHLRLTAVALLLCAPAIATGFAIDDHVLRVLARDDSGIAGLHADPWFLFSFTSGRPEDNRALMDEGVLLPWWSDEQHLNAFLRPLSSLDHRLDFALWPDAAWLMHLHSLVWFASLLLVVAHVYRTLAQSERAVAVLAFALFALDEAHGMTVGWIANRNALIAAALALPAVSAHHRFAVHGFRPGRLLGPACFALGLSAGETALSVFGYVLAHAATLDRRPLPARALSLAPYLLVIGAWRVAFTWLGLGSAGSGAYHDPGSDPLGYAQALLVHLPVLVSSQVALPLADVWFWGPREAQAVLFAICVACALGFAAVAHLCLRRDVEARFWMLGMLLSAFAVAASVPGERLLLVPSVGGAAVIAKLLWATQPTAERAPAWHRPLFGALLFVHLLASPIGLPVRAVGVGVLASAIARADADLPVTPAISDQAVIVLNAPFDVLVSYLQVGREARGAPRPRHVHWLADATSPLRIEVRDARTLRVRPERGFLSTSAERHYRADPYALRPGMRVELTAFSAEVVGATTDGRPAVVDFHFREPLDSPRLRLVRYQDGRLLPWSPPAPGSAIELPREDYFATLLGEAIRTVRGGP